MKRRKTTDAERALPTSSKRDETFGWLPRIMLGRKKTFGLVPLACALETEDSAHTQCRTSCFTAVGAVAGVGTSDAGINKK
eukprot:1158687-Pelagomonas_calceolata.AAC.15